jgi:hypothetical protein
VEVWPENWSVVSLFARISTQWRVGFSGPVGLDYGVLFRLMDEEALSRKDWRQTLDDIQVMEVEALNKMSEAHVS